VWKADGGSKDKANMHAATGSSVEPAIPRAMEPAIASVPVGARSHGKSGGRIASRPSVPDASQSSRVRPKANTKNATVSYRAIQFSRWAAAPMRRPLRSLPPIAG